MGKEKEKGKEEQIKELTNALPKAYEGLAEAAWQRTKKYKREEDTIKYLKSEGANTVGLVKLLSSYNPDLPGPFDEEEWENIGKEES